MSATLAEAQAFLLGALQQPEKVDPAQRDRLLRGGPGSSAASRLSVYQTSYRLRLLRCLASQYPALCHALGQGLFDDFALEYLRSRPPTSHSLHDLGVGLPDWLRDQRPDAEAPEAWVELMLELSAYEALLYSLYDAPGPDGPWPGEATPDEALRVQPLFALRAHRFAVARYYHEVRRGEAPNLPPMETERVAVVRRGTTVMTWPLSALEHALLQRLVEGEALPAALRALADQLGRPVVPLQAAWAGAARGRWIDAGFFLADGID